MDETEEGQSEADVEQPHDDSAILLAHFMDAGLIYTDEGDDKWVVFLARTLNSKISVKEIKSDGIVITWKATPPSDADIISVQDLTSLRAAEMNLHETSCSLFIPSPRPISQDSSKIKKGRSPKTPAKAKWLVFSIPFEEEQQDLQIEMSPFLPE